MSNSNKTIQELTESNEALENYFRNTVIPQLLIDKNYKLKKFTPPSTLHFNLDSSDLGRRVDELEGKFRFTGFLENINQVLESGEILEKEVQTQDKRWFQMNILPYITKEDQKLSGVIITFIEITARIRDLKEQEHLISEHETLLDTISHDIKNSLASLIVSTELLESIPPGETSKQKKIVNVVKNAAHSIQEIISELSERRMQEYKYQSAPELLSFENILEDVKLSLSDLIQQSSADIKTEITASEIYFSRRRLRSILYNLISNAIKYRSIHRPLEIFIKTELIEGYFKMIIQDNGIGIDRENLDSIFSKYVRFNTSKEGTGIGLYLVKKNLTDAGGDISLQSQPGKGTIFTVLFKR